MSKNILRTGLLIVAVAYLCLGLTAEEKAKDPNQTLDPALFSKLEYRFIGPTRGGRVTAVTGIPDQPLTFFMGTTGGGVWKTADGGISVRIRVTRAFRSSGS